MMPTIVDSIVGNIYRDAELKKKYEEASTRSLCEFVKIHRMESQRVRMRKTTDKGTDIAITLPSGTKLRHGDVLLLNDQKMVVLQLDPENVIMLHVKDNLFHHHQHSHQNKNNDDDDNYDHAIEVPVRIGHAIGNLHRPLKLEGRRIYFPIQSESEVEMFTKMFAPFKDHLDIKSIKMVFEPNEGVDVHEH
jgi:urease accessory protein